MPGFWDMVSNVLAITFLFYGLAWFFAILLAFGVGGKE